MNLYQILHKNFFAYRTLRTRLKLFVSLVAEMRIGNGGDNNSLNLFWGIAMKPGLKNVLTLIMGILTVQFYAQNYAMTSVNHNETFPVCSGTFTDNGGPNGNYANGISNRTITFCPSTPGTQLRINFTQFHTENWDADYDVLKVYYGDTATGVPDQQYSGNLAPFVIIAPNPDECITFSFSSDGLVNYNGWRATISCVMPCSPPVAVLSDETESNLCASSTDNNLTFDASSSYTTDSSAIIEYIWDWGDGSSSSSSTPVATNTYANPGVYIVRLVVRTNNTTSNPNGCISTNDVSKIVRVLPPPDFTGTSVSQTVSCSDTVVLTGMAASQSVVGVPPPGLGSETALPDLVGTYFESAIDMSGYFPPGATLGSACLPNITLNLEHSWSGDLIISLIAPSGQEVTLFNRHGGNNFFGYCVNNNDDEVPGCPAPYHVVNSGGRLWTAANATHTLTQRCSTYSGSCYAGDYYRQNQTYNSTQSLSGLIGTPLNGVWRLRIRDMAYLDDGFLDSWSLNFPVNCYNELETATPLLSGGLWSHNGTGPAISEPQSVTETAHVTTGIQPCPDNVDCTGNQLNNTVTVGPFTSPGDYDYTFTVTDEYGCTYTQTVTVHVPAQGQAQFEAFQTVYCLNETADTLPLPNNGVTGHWEPAEVDTSEVGTETYTFISDCGTEYPVDITVNPLPGLSPIGTSIN